MTMPKLDATFQAQQWINDNAVDCAPIVRFDAAAAVLALDAKQLAYIVAQANLSSGRDLDMIAEFAGYVGSGSGRHDGPFHVDIDETELADFLFEIGVRDLENLDEATWAAVKGGDPQQVPTPAIG